MNRSICVVGLMGLLGCSSAVGGAGARPSASTLAGPRSGKAVAASNAGIATPRASQFESPTAALEYHAESAADQRFIENAERAIGEYSEFIARAGDGADYAPAVKRSREQIEDLRAAIVFVRAGAAQRAAH